MKAVQDTQRSRTRGGEKDGRARKLLSLQEVRASGLPAFYTDHGERLLYMDGELYDLRDTDGEWQAGSRPLPLPRHVLEDGVGVEFGWWHSHDCTCPLCWKRELLPTGRTAVA